MKAPKPTAAPSPGAAPLWSEADDRGNEDLSLIRTNEPSGNGDNTETGEGELSRRAGIAEAEPGPVNTGPRVDAEERRKAGLGGVYLPGPVTWLQMDGERASVATNGRSIGWRENPGEEPYLVERRKPVNPAPWLEEKRVREWGRVFLGLLSLWYPGRGGRLSGDVPAPIWAEFIRRVENLYDGDRAHASALLGAIRADAEEMRTRQLLACGQRVMVGLYREKQGEGWGPSKVEYRRWRCKAWPCPHCSQRLQYEAGAKLAPQLAALRGSSMPLFLTLTLDPKHVQRLHPYASPVQLETLSWKLIRANWKGFMRRVRRRYGSAEYSMRIEAHTSGWAHLHAVVSSPSWWLETEQEERLAKRARPGRAWLSKAAVRSGYGRICDVQRVAEPHSMAYYIAKASSLSKPGLAAAYEVTKGRQLRSHLLPRGTRTLERSRGWGHIAIEGGILADIAAYEPPDRVEREYSSIGMLQADMDYLQDIRTEENYEGLGVQSREVYTVRDWALGTDDEAGRAPKVAERYTETLESMPACASARANAHGGRHEPE
jgi:hypothetical protein